MSRSRPAAAALVCGLVGLVVPLAGAVPLVPFTRRDGDLLPAFVVSLAGVVLGATGIALGIITRRDVGAGPERRRATAGIWLGAAAIPTSAILFVALVEAAVSAFEF
jgi:VIT1/CCC1 family predicted Fe2+/Mn2+ transporter